MEVEINYDSLSESPYSTNNAGAFTFDEDQVQNLLNDLTLSSPTCYLVSGYRGVGKTSLIKRVETEIIKSDKDDTTGSKTIFVHTSFARIETRMNVVRRLIRELYLRIEKTKSYQDINNKEHHFKRKFEMLYQQTFKEVTLTSSEHTTREASVAADISPMEVVRKIAVQIAPLVALIPWYVFSMIENSSVWFIRYLVPVALILWSIFNTINFSIRYLIKKESSDGMFTKTLFDDEIAGTLFFDVLKNLNELKFRIVFILDELDKASPTELDSLIHELKPYLLCGHANFVVVGGQNLYYKFKEDDNVDDAVMSSLFAKVYHVRLSTPIILKEFFQSKVIEKENIEKLSEDDRKQLDLLIDYLVLSSRLVPRRFITLLRQNIYWKDKRPYLTDDKLPRNVNLIKGIVKAIDELDDEKITADQKPAIRDYIITKMYIKCYAAIISNTVTLNKNAFVNG